MTPVDKALLVSAEQILRINGYEAEAGAVGRVGENLESAERDAGRWRPIETASIPNGPPCRPLTDGLGVFPPVLDACCGSRMFWFDRKDSRATFVDKRRERHTLPDVSSKGGSRELVIDQLRAEEPALAALAEKYRDVAFNVSTTKGMDEAQRKLDEQAAALKRQSDELAARQAVAAIKWPEPAPIAAVVEVEKLLDPGTSACRPTVAAASEDLITTGAINERLAGVTVKAEFLKSLGFTSVKRGAAEMWPESDLPLIVTALITHLHKLLPERIAA